MTFDAPANESKDAVADIFLRATLEMAEILGKDGALLIGAEVLPDLLLWTDSFHDSLEGVAIGVKLYDVLNGRIHVVLTLVLAMGEAKAGEDNVVSVKLARCHVAKHATCETTLISSSELLENDGALLCLSAILSAYRLRWGLCHHFENCFHCNFEFFNY